MNYLNIYQPGDRVLVSVDSNTALNFTSHETGIAIEVPVIGRDTHCILLGFETKINTRVWDILPGDLDNLSVIDRVSNIDIYKFGWWAAPEDVFIVGKVFSKPKSDGTNCKQCQQYYPYAVPNQLDGTLICYGCKLFLA